jgi:hypothetical protein
MTVNTKNTPAETANGQAYDAAQARTKAQRVLICIGTLHRRCDSEIFCGESNIQKFKADLSKDPLHTLQWADGFMTSVASMSVWSKVKQNLTDGCTVWDLRDHAFGQALRGARHPSRSTSTAHNIMDEECTRAWAEAAEALDKAVEFLTSNGITKEDAMQA